MKNKSLLMTIAISLIAISSFAQVKGLFTDSRDGKIYKTVTIGTQTWMAENLAYKASSGCWAYNDSVSYVATYGYLYNWETAKTVCPTGWHLPTEAEWTTLTTYLGGDSVAGGKLKSTTNWNSPNTGATNSSGFTAIPGGRRFAGGYFGELGFYGYWWSSSESEIDAEFAKKLVIIYEYNVVEELWDQKVAGLSVRCIKDK